MPHPTYSSDWIHVSFCSTVLHASSCNFNKTCPSQWFLCAHHVYVKSLLPLWNIAACPPTFQVLVSHPFHPSSIIHSRLLGAMLVWRSRTSICFCCRTNASLRSSISSRTWHCSKTDIAVHHFLLPGYSYVDCLREDTWSGDRCDDGHRPSHSSNWANGKDTRPCYYLCLWGITFLDGYHHLSSKLGPLSEAFFHWASDAVGIIHPSCL